MIKPNETAVITYMPEDGTAILTTEKDEVKAFRYDG
jgi:hypothetical protein